MNNIEQKLNDMQEEVAQVSKIAAELTTAKSKREKNKLKIIIFILSVFLAISVGINLWFVIAYERVEEVKEVTTTTTFEGI